MGPKCAKIAQEGCEWGAMSATPLQNLSAVFDIALHLSTTPLPPISMLLRSGGDPTKSMPPRFPFYNIDIGGRGGVESGTRDCT